MSALWVPLAVACLYCGPPAEFDLPPGPAVDTIVQWSKQAHLQVLFDYNVVRPYASEPVAGLLEPLEALQQMLWQTDLKFEYVTPRTVAVYELQHYCRPEWGSAAPLPPCVQKPLIIKGAP
jgi:hypothetical protein